MSMNIYPEPATARFSRRPLVGNPSEIYIEQSLLEELLPHLTELLPMLARRLGRPLQLTASPIRKSQAFMVIERKERLGSEAYHMEARDTVLQILAGDAAGGYYALHTLRQIVEQTTGPLPGFSIQDAPVFASRGIMLDISRCKVPQMHTLFRLVEKMAAMKLNQLQLYTEHTFAFQEHPVVWKSANPMTADEILQLDVHCRKHFIELVPNFNSFGHWERWLKHDAYKNYANCPAGFTNCWGTNYPHGAMLKPHKPSLKLLDELFAEMLPNFSSGQFNVGCDETFELGSGWSKKRCEKEGTYRVYVDFLQQINRRVEKHGRQMQFWGDIILNQPELIPELPPNSTALAWGYEANHPFDKNCRAFQSAGLPYYVCPGTSSWNSITGRTANALENLKSAARHGSRHGASGYLITDWGDNGHHQSLPVSYLGYAAGACQAWNPSSNQDSGPAANRIWFEDSRGDAADVFAELGRVLEPISLPFANSSAFHHLLFHRKPAHEKLLNIPTRELKQCARRLDTLEERRSEIRGKEAGIIRKEFTLALRMTRLALDRGLAMKAHPLAEPPHLKRSLLTIERQHRTCWETRNRPGGLNESCDWFKRITR
ncbi:MAG: hexosaminidase [Kiritimatiellia bacterium]|jgi:hexosaminidase